jgi:hypothetical protein
MMAIKKDFYINEKGDVPAADYAYTMAAGGAGAQGSVAVPWVKNAPGGANLPEEIRKLLYGPTGQPGAYDPFTNATGYAIDPNTGQLIIRQGEGGGSYTGINVKGVGTGQSVDMTNPSMGPASSFAAAGLNTDGTPLTSTGTKSTGVNDPVNAERKSAYDLLYNEFNKYGLASLVEDIKGIITDANTSPAQISLALQNTKAYQQRFSANQDRIKAGLTALTPAEYIGLEDQYQSIMRNYGLPASYYAKDTMGKQAGFDKFIAGDVSATELEDRIATAQQRVINSNPEVLKALKQFYPDINNADILAYTLDPQKALTEIKRKVSAAEIGGAALAQGLEANGGTAESLAGLGITKAQAQQGYTDIAGILPTASKLSDIYGQGPYTQGTAEAEVFNTAGAAQAAAKRKKLVGLETAAFSGSSGVGALGRDKSIYGAMQGQAGLY